MHHQARTPRPGTGHRKRPPGIERPARLAAMVVVLLSALLMATPPAGAQDPAVGELVLCYDLSCDDAEQLVNGMEVSEQIFGIRWLGQGESVTFTVDGPTAASTGTTTERYAPYDAYTTGPDNTSRQKFHPTGPYTVAAETNDGRRFESTFTVTKLVACLDPGCGDRLALENAVLSQSTFGIRWLGNSPYVDFEVDGRRLRRESIKPFDAYGTGPDNTSNQQTHSPGVHTVVATRNNGDTFEARFTVVDGGGEWSIDGPAAATLAEPFPVAASTTGGQPVDGDWSLPDGPYPVDRTGNPLVSIAGAGPGQAEVTALVPGDLRIAYRSTDGTTKELTVTMNRVDGYEPDQIRNRTYGPRSGVGRPANAVDIGTDQDLVAEVAARPDDTVFYLAAGVHRIDRTLRLKPGQELIGRYGAVITGAIEVTESPASVGGGVYRISDGVPANPRRSDEHAGKCKADRSGCHLPEQLFIGDRQLRQVTSRSEVSDETFYYDPAGAIYFARLPAGGEAIEFTVNPQRMIELSTGSVLQNLEIRRWPGSYQQTAVGGPADALGVVMVSNRFHQISGAAVGLPSGSTFTGNVVSQAGELGLNASGTFTAPLSNVRIIDNRLEGNNVDGWKWAIEGGGSKFTHVRGLLARGNHLVGNDGSGLWSDGSNWNHVYEYNLAEDNLGDSYFYEISTEATIRYNVARQTGNAPVPIDETGNAVTVSESHDVDVYGNQLMDNNAAVHIKQEMCRGMDGDGTVPADGRADEWYIDDVVVAYNDIRQRDYGTESGDWPDGKGVKFALERWSGPAGIDCQLSYRPDDDRENWTLEDWYLRSDIRFQGNAFALFDAAGNPDDGSARLFWDYDDIARAKAELTLAQWKDIVDRRAP